MEEHTRALEIVCQHFRHEYMSRDIAKHRKALQCAHQRNSRLNAKNNALKIKLIILRKRFSNMRHELFLTCRLLEMIE